MRNAGKITAITLCVKRHKIFKSLGVASVKGSKNYVKVSYWCMVLSSKHRKM